MLRTSDTNKNLFHGFKQPDQPIINETRLASIMHIEVDHIDACLGIIGWV